MLKALFYKFPAHTLRVYSPRNILWQLAGVAATYVLVTSGADWLWYSSTRGLFNIFFPAAILGFIVPVALPLALYLWGRQQHDAQMARAGAASGQAVLIAYIISCVYKAFTGRAHPLLFGSSLVDTSRQFHFGFLKSGVFWGWPSSHTAVAFALATALIMLYPREKDRVVRIFLGLYALYVGIGVSATIHWLSDAVMGAVLGIIAGAVVAKGFRTRA